MLSPEKPQRAEQPGQLLHNLLLFGRLLRGLGVDLNPGRMITLVKALSFIDIGHKADFFYTMRCLLVRNKDDLSLFDQAFELFWRAPFQEGVRLNLSSLGKKQPERPDLSPPPLPAAKPPAGGWEQQSPDEGEIEMLEATRTYSDLESLRLKDFSELDSREIAAIKKMMAELMWQLGQRRTRRKQPGRGSSLDMRRSLRRNMRHGGEILQWSHRKPKVRPRPLVIIADVSGSMERYTRLLLHFIYSLTRGLQQPVEAFVFSTRLTRITRQLHDRDVDRAMAEVSQHVHDWSGGTRIGLALKRFNYDWARRVLGHGAVVLLISDGWDRGDPQLLGREITRLQRSCQRLIWLNPLLGSPEYEPLTRGMQACLPYIDDFLPVHNLASLEALADRLSQVGERRPARRQQSVRIAREWAAN